MLASPLVTALLERLTLEQKVRLLTGASLWTLQDEPAVGLRPIVVSDGPTGVRGAAVEDLDPSASLPSAGCVCATWDLEQVRRLGALIAAEARAKDVDVVLGPTVNLHRSPRGGRHFEAYSEDPYLTGEFGAAYVTAVQAHGVATTAKHYVANDSETDRFTVDARVDERTLREVYLAPFERMVKEGAWLVMSAYNSVNGTTMTANPLLRDPLKDEWGFDGVVVSDWMAVRDTEPSANSGQDLAMPGPDGTWGDALVEAVKAGRVPEDTIDEKVARLLLLASRVGALESGPATVPVEPWDDTAIAGLLREAAADGMVLARNNGTLPAPPRERLTVGVIGQHALRARAQGGGSASVFPRRVVTPLDGLREAYGADAIDFAPGLPPVDELHPFAGGTVTDPLTGDHGVHVRYLDQDGETFSEETIPSGRFSSFGDPRLAQATRLELTTRFTPDRDGRHDLGFAGLGGFTFEIDGVTVSTGPLGVPEGGDPMAALLNPPSFVVSHDLSRGRTVELRLTYTPELLGYPFASVKLGFKDLFGDPEQEFQRAIEVAAASDVAVVVVGTTEAIESEGFDRPGLALPEGQDELVRRVAEVNPRTVVVVNSGAPVLMPWLDEVAAVVLAWFPGQEFGAALADVLTGAREPGGRLPTTWPTREEDVPVWEVTPDNGRLAYTEGLRIGYRAWLKREADGGNAPALPFGSGLGYTTWQIDAPTLTIEGDRVVVLAEVTNTGARHGKQVLQAYLSRPGSTVERPVAWLAGFTAVRADAGERVRARIEIAPRAFQHWDTEAHAWVTEPGAFTLRIATSVADPGHGVTVNPAAQG
ncbi:beta-glucosidase [Streptomyces cyslabdanicus]|uniref:beta-glucosidase n=1 Tax=Streptomyces cyslabdanicus TaxID=1470456 RepID=UPI0040444EB3